MELVYCSDGIANLENLGKLKKKNVDLYISLKGLKMIDLVGRIRTGPIRF